jgi:hypothetical protein
MDSRRLPDTPNVGERPRMLSEWKRWGSPVAVARKSTESKVMRLPGSKLPPPVNTEVRVIGVEDVTWHAIGLLPGTPTIMVSGIGGQ